MIYFTYVGYLFFMYILFIVKDYHIINYFEAETIIIRVFILGDDRPRLVKGYSHTYNSILYEAHQLYLEKNNTYKKFHSKDPLWNYIDPYPFDSIYNSHVNICDDDVFNLMIIPSRAKSLSERHFFRNQFKRTMIINGKKVNRLFVVALEDNDYEIWQKIYRESCTYNDIIISRTPEGNIHLSKIMWNVYYYIANNCMQTTFITKLDTDSIIHIQNLINILEKLPTKQVYTGHVWKKGNTHIPIRKKDERWVFPSDYTHHKKYQKFVSGVCEIFSVDIIPFLAVGHNYQPIFMTAGEDIMAGIVLDLVGIKPKEFESNCKIIPSTKYMPIPKEFAVIHSPDYKNLKVLENGYKAKINNNSNCWVIYQNLQ